jgi:hypothetical protein
MRTFVIWTKRLLGKKLNVPRKPFKIEKMSGRNFRAGHWVSQNTTGNPTEHDAFRDVQRPLHQKSEEPVDAIKLLRPATVAIL